MPDLHLERFHETQCDARGMAHLPHAASGPAAEQSGLNGTSTVRRADSVHHIRAPILYSSTRFSRKSFWINAKCGGMAIAMRFVERIDACIASYRCWLGFRARYELTGPRADGPALTQGSTEG